MRRQGVPLGIMPDFAANIKNGLRADLVTPGKPAALGGMKKGDIITAINGNQSTHPGLHVQDGTVKHGETISVEVTGKGKKKFCDTIVLYCVYL
jgi:S1-C subfamily serine protease